MNHDEEHEAAVTNQYAWIMNYNAHVEHQHNYYGKMESEEAPPKPFVMQELHFFDPLEWGSEERQQLLVALLDEMASTIDTTSGRGWFCIYAGYRYYKKQLAVKGGYTDFFADIEALLPHRLTKVRKEKTGEERYHSYTTLLGREADLWYMDKGNLPPLNEITTWKNRFSGDKNRYALSTAVIVDFYRRLKGL